MFIEEADQAPAIVRLQQSGRFPLSFQQEQLWYASQSEGGTSYQIPLALRLIGEIDIDSIDRAIHGLMSRHESLTTVYEECDGRVWQKITDKGGWRLRIIDEELYGNDRASLEVLMDGLATQPFDLSKDHALRAYLIKLGESEYVLLMILHSIAVDRTSIGILIKEFTGLYRSYTRGEPANAASLPVRYVDYSIWQRQMSEDEHMEEKIAFWRGRLQALRPLCLSTDQPTSSVKSTRGNVLKFHMGSELMGRINELAKRQSTSSAIVLLAAFKALLYEYSGEEDICVIGVINDRQHREIEGVVGLFSHKLLLRTHISGATLFAQLIGQVKKTYEEAYAFREIPWGKILRQQKSDGYPDCGVMFEFAGSETHIADHRVPGIDLEELPMVLNGTRYNLMLLISEQEGGLTGTIEYRSDLFKEETIAGMAEGFMRILQSVIEFPEKTIAELKLRSSREIVTRTNKRSTMDFSLFYFSSQGDKDEKNKYDFLLHSAKWGDEHGFTGIWTPERHFHEFGGIFPNPAVLGAALAVSTSRIEIRSGSVVLPLNDVIRVAEEWSVVDNLSGGRVSLSIASGWHADDFVLMPGSYSRRQEIMFKQIEDLRNLWKGKGLLRRNGFNKDIEVKIYPRPLTAMVPIWITTAGNIETFESAGKIGANVLTHMLGQEIGILEKKISVYRKALINSGHNSEERKIAVMLHTFLGEDLEKVKEEVRDPFIAYLKSSVNLIKKLVQGEDLGEQDIDEKTIDSMVSMVFERHWQTSALLGTRQSCLPLIEKLHAIGVTEIACLIDFGVNQEKVLRNLVNLGALKDDFKAI
ncbi:MupA/Atu3671 family FMN-dependent luciferase-like monooxygenase [Puia dinghuensis]|uniref:LLM class flavin-dependent oxidoreductase n=1 Tax=Puia dinghuensis TaxID=1792502 RepID=A0A8J2U625_9BACT|nr:MupA/Atu3671 family FMN-dependent luciferase-like monooxygenase [Puia dinghuensis]GGA81176.1 hypothetical protein GCM10011511_00180 [Puia dinghuensis]